MLEITGSVWGYAENENAVILITTNGFVKKNGDAVMGRGIALQAKTRYPGIEQTLGSMIVQYGNVPCFLLKLHKGASIWSFPVKHNWWEPADLDLIKKSVRWLELTQNDREIFVTGRPGCGNGKRDWEKEVKPLMLHLPDSVIVLHQDYVVSNS